MGTIGNRVAIVTGGSGGIGGAIVRRFARAGAKLAVAPRCPHLDPPVESQTVNYKYK